MYSEFGSFVLPFTAVMTILSILILRFTGSNSIYFMLGAILVISIFIALFLGVFLKIALILLCISSSLALLTNFLIIYNLQENGLFTMRNFLILLIIMFLTYRYAFHYNKYIWKTFTITHENSEIKLLHMSLFGIKNVNRYEEGFRKEINIYDKDRMNSSKNKRIKLHATIFKGIPKFMTISLYSKRSGQLYKGEFKLPKNKINSLTGSRWHFPLSGIQKYNTINLIIHKDGKVALQLGNEKEDIEFFQGDCELIKESDLSFIESNNYEKITKNKKKDSESKSILAEKSWDLLLKKNIIVKHEITGLTDQIISITAITTNGERYTVDKTFWNSRTIPKIKTPLAAIHIQTINNTGEYINWDYLYDLDDLVQKLNEIDDDKKIEIKYTYDLHNDKDNLLHAISYEYFNGEKNELKGDINLTKIPNK